MQHMFCCEANLKNRGTFGRKFNTKIMRTTNTHSLRKRLDFKVPLWCSFAISILVTMVSAQSDAPSFSPSNSPSITPSVGNVVPSSSAPSVAQTTTAPTVQPSVAPTVQPNVAPTVQSSVAPSIQKVPTTGAPSTSNAPTVEGFTGVLELTALGWVVSTDKGTPIYTAETLPEETKTQHLNAYEATVIAALTAQPEQGVEYIQGSAVINGYIDSTCPDEDPNTPSTKNCIDVIASFKVNVVNRQIDDLIVLINAVHDEIDSGTLQQELDNIFSEHPLDILEGFGPTNTLAPTVAASVQPTVSLYPSLAPSISSPPSPAPTKSAPPSISQIPSMSPSQSIQPSNSPTITGRPSLSNYPSSIPSVSQVPSAAPSISHRPTLTMPPSLSPSISMFPSGEPSLSGEPSAAPSPFPSGAPSISAPPTRTLFTGEIDIDLNFGTSNVSGLQAFMMEVGILYSQMNAAIESLVTEILEENAGERLLEELVSASGGRTLQQQEQEQQHRHLLVSFIKYEVTLAQDTDCPADSAENTNCVNFYGVVKLNLEKEVRSDVEGLLQEELQKSVDTGKLEEELQDINRFFPLTILNSDPGTSAPSTAPSVTPPPDEGMGVGALIGIAAGATMLLACCGGAGYYYYRRRRARMLVEKIAGVEDGASPPMAIEYDRSKQEFPDLFDDEPMDVDDNGDGGDQLDPLSTFQKEQPCYPDVFGDGPNETFGTRSPSSNTDQDNNDNYGSESSETSVDDLDVVEDLEGLRIGHSSGVPSQY